MLKYHLTALALKGFSTCKPARRLYRILGNRLGGRGRRDGAMPFYYYERVARNIAICQAHAPLTADDLLLELGTGWVHWEALTLRLFFDFQAVLYDVWDNRQLDALKSFLRQLAQRFGEPDFLVGCDFERARRLIEKIQSVASFDELYALLGFRYVVDPAGLMENLPSEAFRVVISAGVMEHIPAETAGQFVANMAARLRPGGLAVHSINITDHLYLYDRTASPKQYLTFSEPQWQRWCENGVQYINRIQRGEWLEMFARAGLTLLEESGAYTDLRDLPIHPRYRGLSKEDRDCTTLDVVLRKDPS